MKTNPRVPQNDSEGNYARRIKQIRRGLTAIFGIFCVLTTQAQSINNAQTEPEVTVPGIVSTSSDNEEMRTLANTVLPSARYAAHIDLNQPSLTLDRLDVRSLALDDNQIGVNRSVAVSPNTRAQKFVNPDGSQIIVLIIKSSGASGIGIHFRDFALADGEEVYVYGTAPDSIVSGPFTDKGPWEDGEFWSDTVDGDTVVIEFYKKTDENGKGFEVFEVSHILAELDWRLRSNEPDVLNCERDASCNPVSERNAVARIVFNNNGAHVCTGTLLNDVAHNFCPYFLTANHCVPTQQVAGSVKVYWFYQTTSCNSGVLRTGGYSPPGTTLLKTQSSNDFSLLRLLHTPPTGAYFSGWSSAAQSIGTSVFGLHHPDGYVPPAIPSYLRRSNGTIRTHRPPPNGSCLVNSYEIGWTTAGTEEGSSGSGLFTTVGHYLVGVLSCGSNPMCSNAWDNYSTFHNFYSQIQPYIGSLTAPPPVANAATLVTNNSFRANWRSVCGATGYRLDVSTSSSFSSYVTGYHNLNVGTALNRSVTSLNASTTYYYRVRAYNGNGASGNSNVVHVTTLSLPTPTPTPTPAGIPSIIISSVVSTITGHNQYWTDYSVAVYGRTTGTPYYYTYEAGWGIYGTINRTLSLNPENWSFYFTYTQFPGPPSTYEIWAEEYDGSYTLVAHDSQSITFTY